MAGKIKNSQGKDPRTFEENSQGGDLSTLETNSQGKDPRTFRETVESWRVQKKRKGEKWEKKKKKKKEEGEVQNKELVEKVQRKDSKPLYGEDKKEKKGRQKEKQTRARQVLVKSGRCLFLFLLFGQNCLCVNGAAEGLQKRTEMMEKWQQQEVRVEESRWAEEIPPRWKQPKVKTRLK